MLRRILTIVVAIVLLAAVGVGGYWGYRQRKAAQHEPAAADAGHEGHNHDEHDHEHDQGHDHGDHTDESAAVVKLSPHALQNLSLVSKPLEPTTYWRVIELPGVIVDRPGVSDRGVVAPIAGTVTKIHAFPGASVVPEAPLFTIRLVSESLHASQLELYKATREIEIAQRQRQRLADLAQSGALAQSRILEIDNQLERLQVTVDAYRQDLASRGLSPERIAAAAAGQFVTEMMVRAPPQQAPADQVQQRGEVALASQTEGAAPPLAFHFELESLNVELGQQVEAGHLLCHLADHRRLQIEGRGFADDIPLVQRAARNGWEVEVDFGVPASESWPPLAERLRISHLSNSIDPETRTFAFFLPLENQWQAYAHGGDDKLLWRFRPGGRLRLRTPVERLDNVFVVPRDAIVRDGPEAFMFRQGGEIFERISVHVVHEDRLNAVLVSSAKVRAGFHIAQSGAASLNRILKSQAAGSLPANVHVHADGTVHGAH